MTRLICQRGKITSQIAASHLSARVPLKIYSRLPTPNPARVTGTQGFDKDDRREKPDRLGWVLIHAEHPIVSKGEGACETVETRLISDPKHQQEGLRSIS